MGLAEDGQGGGAALPCTHGRREGAWPLEHPFTRSSLPFLLLGLLF